MIESRYSISGMQILDLFAGTGFISIEFCSRDAAHVTSVDRNFKCAGHIKNVVKILGISNLTVFKSDVGNYLKSCSTRYDIIFADPPFEEYDCTELHKIIFSRELLTGQGTFILEHISSESYDNLSGFSFSRKYGNVTFSFFNNFESE